MYDLHTHSHYSDGEFSPTALIQLAKSAGIQFLALTDHDTVEGLPEAKAAASDAGLEFISGVEISTRWKKNDIHIVGLNVDETHPELLEGLASQTQRREERVLLIAEKLTQAGCGDALAGVRALAGKSVITRAHFAGYLLLNGYIKEFQAAFKKYLGRGKVAYVETQWASIPMACQWIRAAGGTPVIAHPARYGLTATKLRELVSEFKAAGGQALEVVSGVQSVLEAANLGQLAKRFELHGSMGSDYHGSKTLHVKLGSLAPMPGSCPPVWELWRKV